MIRAYDELLLPRSEASLAGMLDYAVYSLHQGAPAFLALFTASGLAALVERGDVRTLTGLSGVELACEVMERCGLDFVRVRPRFTTGHSKEYRSGQVLARCQWETGLTFNEILRDVPVQEILAMIEEHQLEVRRQLMDVWPPVMNADDPAEKARRDREAVLRISRRVIQKVSSAKHETHLKTMRLRNGLSQSRLAAASGVPLRTIQQYEQRQKDIDRAQFTYLVKLAAALNCDPLQLYERTENAENRDPTG
ncbi:MAG: helix-turn-helix transcriptional regulator [Mogibacterium sp.]|nr:helix-turn-helix transcriptional regulator [Mogibacterium sp.]